MSAYDDGLYLADTSAWISVSRDQSVAVEFAEALRADQIRTCPIVLLELMRGAWDLADLAALQRRFEAVPMLPTTHSVCLAAIQAINKLASIAPGPKYHQVNITDALIAATAEDRGVGVLHYDRHFDRLERVLHFESRWIAAPGSF